MGKHGHETINNDTSSSNKRCKKESRESRESRVCGSLKEALILAESAPAKNVGFPSAWEVFERVRSFRVASVVYVSRLPSYMWDNAVQLETQIQLTEEESKIFLAFSAIMEDKCCRQISEKMIIPSDLLKLVQPLIKKFPARKLKKISSIADFIEYMIPRTNVNFRGDEGNPSMNDWEAYNKWLDEVTKRIPLLLEILDPAFLVIREAGGAAPTAPVTAALGNIPVGAVANAGVQLTHAPIQVTDPNGVATIPGLYQFQNRTEAGNTRMALVTWAAMLPVPITLEILRFATDPNGLEWM